MFQLTTIRDTIRLHPAHLIDQYMRDHIRVYIHKKYCNRIIRSIGLAVAVFCIDKIGEAFLPPGDGGAHIKTTFQMLMWRPQVGELIVGKVYACDATGILVTVGFFANIFVPQSQFNENMFFDPTRSVWVWKYDHTDLLMNYDQRIRVKITAVHFATTSAPAGVSSADESSSLDSDPIDPTLRSQPMLVMATVAGDGLGMVSWWVDGETC